MTENPILFKKESFNMLKNSRIKLTSLSFSPLYNLCLTLSVRSLRQLNLPSALEALEKPIGLPPSLLRKAEEVRREDGPQKIEATLADVSRLAQHDQTILDDVRFDSPGSLMFFFFQLTLLQALDILDAEASEDEAARNQIPLNRLKSYEANVELIQKATRYRNILLQATESDETVRQKWDEWEESITELTLDEVRLILCEIYTKCVLFLRTIGHS